MHTSKRCIKATQIRFKNENLKDSGRCVRNIEGVFLTETDKVVKGAKAFAFKDTAQGFACIEDVTGTGICVHISATGTCIW